MLGRPVMVGDDDLEAERPRVLDLGDAGDAAVDREDEVEPLLGQPRQRAGVQAVALLEARRQVPVDVGAELAQQQHGERGGADAVGVVVAVDADRAPRPRPRRRSSRPPRACRRAGTGRARAARPRGTAGPRRRRRGRAGRAPKRSPRRRRARPRAPPPRRGRTVRAARFRSPSRPSTVRPRSDGPIRAAESTPSQVRITIAPTTAASPPRIQRGCSDSRTVAANARPSRMKTPAISPTPTTNDGQEHDEALDPGGGEEVHYHGNRA